MRTYEVIRKAIEKQGVTQTWVVSEVNKIDPTLEITDNKLSAIVLGKRRILGEEFIALCIVLELEKSDFITCNQAG